MDYEKKYKEALEKAHKLCAYPTSNPFINDLQDLFPELKESEDEKMMNQLHSWIKSLAVQRNTQKRVYQLIKGLLEKQGEQKPVVPKFKVGDVIKQKKDKYGDSTIEIEAIDTANYYYFNKDFSIKISEQNDWELVKQKSVDKVEPKFHDGDWIVYNRNDHSREILQIYDIRDNRYYFNDNVHFSWSVKECDEKSHLWTIQDAKDGDVLVLEDNTFGTTIFICAGFAMNGSIQVVDYHFMYNSSTGHARKKAGDFMGNLALDFHPATMEQRQALFDKMCECGYEWDAEKKELKKIIDEKQIKNNLQDNSFRRMFEQKSIEWSEEDEIGLADALHCIEVARKNAKDENDMGNAWYAEKWLKSLRPQKQWKPSDEQMDAILTVIGDERQKGSDVIKELLKVYHHLKKLKE